MPFSDSSEPDHRLARLRQAWDSVRIARPVHYSLFTFGDSDLPYWLVVEGPQPGTPVSIRQGTVVITRPMIITPGSAPPELRNFFDNDDFQDAFEFLLARTAAFSNLRLDNRCGAAEVATDSVEEAVARLNRRLDSEEEDRVAILTAPAGLGGVAVLRYAADRIGQSARDNIQELRERGFLDT